MSSKINLNDVTFLIPVRIDSIVRMENLIMVIDYLSSCFETNIFVLEASPYDNQFLRKLLGTEIRILWVNDHDPIFHRTRYLNEMVNNCESEYLAIWDADVIVPPQQIEEGFNCLRQGSADFINPFDRFLDTSYIIREMYFSTRDLSILKGNESKMLPLYEDPKPVGGAFLAIRECYVNAGKENENFYGWGVEDGERVNRWMILGYKHAHINGSLYHLTHGRGLNSKFHSKTQREIKRRELFRISAMSSEQIKKEINTWNH